MHLLRLAPLLLIFPLAGFATPVPLTVTPVTWTSAGIGSIGSVSVTVTGLSGGSVQDYDFSSDGFVAGPLSANQSSLDYDAGSDWTITLSSPQDLLLYVKYWRNEGGTPYTFDQPFTILSGFDGATTPTADSLVLSNSYTDGILRFSNVTSVTMFTASTDSSGQAMTFGLATAVPEPSTYALWFGGAAVLAAGLIRHRRSRSAAQA